MPFLDYSLYQNGVLVIADGAAHVVGFTVEGAADCWTAAATPVPS